MRGREVAERWSKGRPGRTATISTDGFNLYSYDLLIGFTTKTGRKIVYNYTSRPMVELSTGAGIPGRFVSMTTSKHVGFALEYTRLLIPPK